MKNIVTFVNSQRRIKITPELKTMLKSCVDTVAQQEGVGVPVCVDITFVSDEKMKSINLEHRTIDKTTDVLSFPVVEFENGVYQGLSLDAELDYDGSLMIGDIIISAQTAVSQAQAYGHAFEREMGFLCVHSMLHLLGYDHVQSEADAKVMRSKEEKALETLGLFR